MERRLRTVFMSGSTHNTRLDAVGVWSEGHVPDPGKSAFLHRAVIVERRRNGTQMAAEVVASAMKDRTLEATGVNRSMGVERQNAA